MSTKIEIESTELSRLIHHIEDFINVPDNSAARTLARISMETLKGYLPETLEKYKETAHV